MSNTEDSSNIDALLNSSNSDDWITGFRMKYISGAKMIDCLSILVMMGLTPLAIPSGSEDISNDAAFADKAKQAEYNRKFYEMFSTIGIRSEFRAAMARELKKSPKPLPEPCPNPDVPAGRYRGCVREDYGQILIDFLSAYPKLPWFKVA